MTDIAAVPPTVPQLILERAKEKPDHIALVVDGTDSLAYGEWIRASGALAHRLKTVGVRPGDRIGLYYAESDWIGYAVGHVAVYLAGGTAIALTERLGAAEIRRRLTYCGASGVLHGAGSEPPDGTWWAEPGYERGAPAAAELSEPPERSTSSQFSDRAEFSGLAEIQPPAVTSDELSDILYTSGTTGDAKPVAVSHANLTYPTFAWGHLFQDVGSILCAVPLGTNAGHNALILALTTDSTIHVLGRSDPESIAAAIAGPRLELAVLPPSVAIQLLADGVLDTHDLTCLTMLMFGSASVPLGMVNKLSQALPDTRMIIGYGSTEVSPALTSLITDPWNEHKDPEYFRRPELATVGEPRRETGVKIVDAEGSPLPPGQVGEICLSSPAPPRSYYRDPEASARVFRDGWAHMGDVGSLDADGILTLHDRAADVVTREGRAFASLRAENELYWHPDVVEAAVFGAPGPDGRTLLVAAVRLRSGDPDGSADGLRDFLAQRLPAGELPDRIVAVDELPHGPIGKVLKRELRRARRWY
ncbi:acyl--CoA ligase [Streptomyces sp. NBC_00841]|uniref:class I adenylate-forming enzyme family protein n=1 Tax=unclassified Streptomyces TaxID=2593676 RepID=UPI002259EFF3|nr:MULTISPECIES: class I adenylate-forming enzyme family protein [unclassified Streptomyces]MCX4530617.1 acyl--CoA ligase [Streptomyces sp. NBC_01669]WSA03631.1 acyl--CoA ligase [Streptomyces sp. NBC_00841]